MHEHHVSVMCTYPQDIIYTLKFMLLPSRFSTVCWLISKPSKKQASCFLPILNRRSCAPPALVPPLHSHTAFSLRLLLLKIIIPHFFWLMGCFQKKLLNLNEMIRSLKEACEAAHHLPSCVTGNTSVVFSMWRLQQLIPHILLLYSWASYS